MNIIGSSCKVEEIWKKNKREDKTRESASLSMQKHILLKLTTNKDMQVAGQAYVKETMVFYHLHGQTGRFTVWVNGSQSLGLVNFVQESRLPFVQISSIYRKTAAKA